MNCFSIIILAVYVVIIHVRRANFLSIPTAAKTTKNLNTNSG